jgi:hypothetical protein
MEIIKALATLFFTTGLTLPQTQPPSSQPSIAKMPAGEFSSQAEAKANCSDNVVWLNKKSHVYHFAGSRDYGHTGSGAYMCQSDAAKLGRTPRNEMVPPT